MTMQEALCARGKIIERIVKEIGHLPPAQLVSAIIGHLSIKEADKLASKIESFK